MDQELLARIDLIERMVSQGRRSTEYWGWCFALWGTGQLTATAWATRSGRPGLAWGVTMAACGIITGLVMARKKATEQAETLVSRSLGAIWLCFGISITLLAFVGNPAGIFNERSFCAVFLALMGLTNVSSGIILRWPLQVVSGIVWWLAAVFAMLGPEKMVPWTQIAMIFFGEVVFGLYLMARERTARRHA
ncbi:MAG TPA: hypothetical protein VJ723_11690 [Candidatus Angelobacter sp.]|nr:hypothetical protein [Candidatus Angelobacter sp.]